MKNACRKTEEQSFSRRLRGRGFANSLKPTDRWPEMHQPIKISLAMMAVMMPRIIGIQVRRTIAIGETPAAPATAMITPATGLSGAQQAGGKLHRRDQFGNRAAQTGSDVRRERGKGRVSAHTGTREEGHDRRRWLSESLSSHPCPRRRPARNLMRMSMRPETLSRWRRIPHR